MSYSLNIRLALALAASAIVSGCVHSKSESIRWQNGTRHYRVYVPEGLDTSKPVPLVVALHGLLMSGRSMEITSGWSEVAEREQFIVIYPEARVLRWKLFYAGLPLKRLDRFMQRVLGARRWPPDDVGFVDAVIAEVCKQHGIDPARIYLSGMSNGGAMAHYLVFKDPESMFSGIGIVGNSMPVIYADAMRCSGAVNRKHLMIVYAQGTADPLSPYGGRADNVLPNEWATLGVQQSARFWADQEGDPPDRGRLIDAGDGKHALPVYLKTYENATSGTRIATYTIEGGGHVWPGKRTWLTPLERGFGLLGKKATNFDASAAMWRFFVTNGEGGESVEREQ